MKKKIVVLVVVIAMLFSIAGCGGKVTLESLLDASAKKAKKVKSFEMGAVIELDVDISMDDMTVGITADGEVDLEYTEDASHMDGDIAYSAATDKQKMEVEAYLIKDDDEFIIYSDQGEGWTMNSSEDDENTDSEDVDKALEALQMGELIGLLSEYEDDLELSDKLEKVNKKDAYLIEGEVDGNYLINLLESINVKEASETFDELIGDSDIDLGDIKVEISLWIDKSSKLPVKMTVDFQGAIDTAMDMYMKMMIEQSGGMLGDEASEYLDSIKIKTNSAMIELTFSSINKVKKIEVPDDVVEEAEENMENGRDEIKAHNEEVQDAIDEIDSMM